MENNTPLANTTSLKKQNFGLIVMLLIELALGVIVSIVAKFPEAATKEEYWKYAMTQPSVIGHLVLSLLILIAAAFFAWKSYRSKDAMWTKVSLIGLIALLIASGSGSRFISTQEDLYSYVMSAGFVVAFIDYTVAWYRTK